MPVIANIQWRRARKSMATLNSSQTQWSLSTGLPSTVNKYSPYCHIMQGLISWGCVSTSRPICINPLLTVTTRVQRIEIMASTVTAAWLRLMRLPATAHSSGCLTGRNKGAEGLNTGSYSLKCCHAAYTDTCTMPLHMHAYPSPFPQPKPQYGWEVCLIR